MGDVFLQLFNVSITASWVVLAVILLRFILTKAPKWIRFPLWAIVGLRLVIPFSFESKISLIPSTDAITAGYNSRPVINSGMNIIDTSVNAYIADSYAEGVTVATGTFNKTTFICAIIWIVGMLLMLTYSVFSYVKLRNSVATAVLLKDNIYQSENVSSPFVLGIFKARIYIPFDIDESQLSYVVSHEKSHIKHFDNLLKPLAFLILSVYWFNPILWLAYILFCRDIELNCDERVVKNLDSNQKADYSQTLLSLSTTEKMISACPVAFGEDSVKHRVKSVLNYKKPAFWIIIIAVALCIVAAVCFLTNPPKAREIQDGNLNSEIDAVIAEAIISDNAPKYYNGECLAEGHIIFGTETMDDIALVYAYTDFASFGFENGNFVVQSEGESPALFALRKSGEVYECVNIEYPFEGAEYAASLEKLFPEKYVKRMNTMSEDEMQSVDNQLKSYAKNYLQEIGRKAEIGRYSDFE